MRPIVIAFVIVAPLIAIFGLHNEFMVFIAGITLIVKTWTSHGKST